MSSADAEDLTCLSQGLDGLAHLRHGEPLTCSTEDKKYPPVLRNVTDRGAAAVTIEYHGTVTHIAAASARGFDTRDTRNL